MHDPYRMAKLMLEANFAVKNAIFESIYNMASAYDQIMTKKKIKISYNALYNITVKFQGQIPHKPDLLANELRVSDIKYSSVEKYSEEEKDDRSKIEIFEQESQLRDCWNGLKVRKSHFQADVEYPSDFESLYGIINLTVELIKVEDINK